MRCEHAIRTRTLFNLLLNSGKKSSNTLSIFNVKTGEWQVVPVTSSGDEDMPRQAYGQSLVMHQGFVYVFTGQCVILAVETRVNKTSDFQRPTSRMWSKKSCLRFLSQVLQVQLTNPYQSCTVWSSKQEPGKKWAPKVQHQMEGTSRKWCSTKTGESETKPSFDSRCTSSADMLPVRIQDSSLPLDILCGEVFTVPVVCRYLLVLGGGGQFLSKSLNVVHAYDLSTDQWETWKCQEDLQRGFPVSRASFACQLLDDYLYVLGGRHYMKQQGEWILNSCWQLNLDTLSWKRMHLSLPMDLSFPTSCVSPAGYIYLFGGIMDNDKRSKKLFRVRLFVPMLKEICWDFLTGQIKNISRKHIPSLKSAGIPDNFLNRLEWVLHKIVVIRYSLPVWQTCQVVLKLQINRACWATRILVSFSQDVLFSK